MNKLLLAFQILVTLTFLLLGGQKVVIPPEQLIEMGMWWVEDFSAFQVRAIGALEFLGAVGLNAPYLLKQLPRILVPVSAAGLGATMIGAVATHVTRGDPAPSIVITSVLFVMCVTLAKKRFDQIKEAELSAG